LLSAASPERSSAPAKSKRSSWLKGLKWLGAAIALPLIALGVQDAVGLIGEVLSSRPPSYAEQLSEIEATADYRTTEVHQADFRGPGQRSYLMVLRSPQTDDENFPAAQPDQIRIYDETPSGKLHLGIVLEPKRRPSDSMSDLSRIADNVRIADFAHSGFPQALVSYADVGPSGPVRPHPLIIAWRPELNRYKAYALMDIPPSLSPIGRTSLYGRVARKYYATPTAFSDGFPASEEAFPAGEQMAMLDLSGDLYLIAGYVLAAHYVNEPEAIEATVTKVDFSFERPFGFPCLSRVIHIPRPASPEANVSNVLRQAFTPKEIKEACV